MIDSLTYYTESEVGYCISLFRLQCDSPAETEQLFTCKLSGEKPTHSGISHLM